MRNKLYLDLKFTRVIKIQSFINIKKYKTFFIHNIEYKLY